jgi:hypothetical protein
VLDVFEWLAVQHVLVLHRRLCSVQHMQHVHDRVCPGMQHVPNRLLDLFRRSGRDTGIVPNLSTAGRLLDLRGERPGDRTANVCAAGRAAAADARSDRDRTSAELGSGRAAIEHQQ